jgi:hypothetical protein
VTVRSRAWQQSPISISCAPCTRPRKAGGSERRLKQIANAAGKLRIAIEMAKKYDPGTLGHSAAWRHAEAAVLMIGELVSVMTALEPVVRAAGERVRGPRRRPRRFGRIDDRVHQRVGTQR